MESEPEKTWYHYASDEQGSTIFITDEQSEVKNQYRYDAFSNTVAKEEQIQNRYQYTGQQFDQKFFYSLTPDELDELWKDNSIRKK